MATTETDTAERLLARSAELTSELSGARDRQAEIVGERDELWRQLREDLNVPVARIAGTAEVSAAAVHQAIARAKERKERGETAPKPERGAR